MELPGAMFIALMVIGALVMCIICLWSMAEHQSEIIDKGKANGIYYKFDTYRHFD